MDSELDKALEDIQKQVLEGYSETVIDHAQHPRNMGIMPNAGGYASSMGSCGDTMEIWLRIRGDRIILATFSTDGCGPNVATLSMITEMAKGKSIAEALKITPEHVLEALGGLPEENIECAILAANTLRGAIRDYLTFKNEPWKRVYKQQR